MAEGKILKGIGGFYYVKTPDGIIECRARGKFRNKNLSPCVGDNVSLTITAEGKGSIDGIFERKNSFIRPPVSNIDSMIIVAAVANPAPDPVFIDKMLIVAEKNNVDVSIVFNKFDLDDGSVNELVQLYRNIGYNAFTTSTIEGVGIELVCKILEGRTTAFAGFSGVGKSSLLNAVLGSEVMQTGEVSERLRRGKHTTRHVELIEYGGGYIVDTPGFSMLEIPDKITADYLKEYFPEFKKYEDGCRFRMCNHTGNSNVCAVCAAAEEGKIAASRFENYKNFLNVISSRKEW